MYDFLRIVTAVPDVSVGDVQFNTDKIIEKLAEINAKNADIAIFPELCITGATCQDLFLQNSLITAAKSQLLRVVSESEKYDFVVSRAVMPLLNLERLCRKNIKKEQKNALPNGIVCLKGGMLDEELKPFKNKVEVVNLSDFFEGEFFETKKVIYLPF